MPDTPVPSPDPSTPSGVPTKWVRVAHHTPMHISRYPYAAYGSNLLLAQMCQRCPGANIVGSGVLPASRLVFARVASIVKDEATDVLIGVYTLTASDVTNLDRYEGHSHTYERYLVTVLMGEAQTPLRCFTYIKRDNTLEAPAEAYYTRILHGFKDWHFPDRRLRRARKRAIDAPQPSRWANKWDNDWWKPYSKGKGGNQSSRPSSANTNYKTAPDQTSAYQSPARKVYKSLERHRVVEWRSATDPNRTPKDYVEFKHPADGHWYQDVSHNKHSQWIYGMREERSVPTPAMTRNGEPKKYVSCAVLLVEWGQRGDDGMMLWRVKNGDGAWYYDVSNKDDERTGMVRGVRAYDVNDMSPLRSSSKDAPKYEVFRNHNEVWEKVDGIWRRKGGGSNEGR